MYNLATTFRAIFKTMFDFLLQTHARVTKVHSEIKGFLTTMNNSISFCIIKHTTLSSSAS